MKILTNRIFLIVICLILAAIIAFVLLPKLCTDKEATMMVLRAAGDITAGKEISEGVESYEKQDKHNPNH